MFGYRVRAAHCGKISLGLAAILLLAGQNVSALDVILVEEHWELHVGGPDEGRSAPQVTMTMSPIGDVESDYFILTLNHWTYPEFAAGGVQVQRWHGEECYAFAQAENRALLDSDQETVSWKQRISLADGHLKFEIIDGNSESWGQFGHNGHLILTVPTSLTRLNAYRPAVSIEQSGISYAGNRVSSLVLKKLEWRTIDGEEHGLVAPIDIATQLDP
jgi:hypothetical protein